MRTEKKFFLNLEQYTYLRERFTFLMARDAHQKNHGVYPIFSRYYDTKCLFFFDQKMDGAHNHTKIRLRNYGQNLLRGPYFLEAKIKNNVDQMKLRVPLDDPKLALDPYRWDEILKKEMHYFQILNASKPLFPTCHVYYEREAFELRQSGTKIRVNFDKNILGLSNFEYIVEEHHYESRQLLPNEYYGLLEVKFDDIELPDFLHDELEGIDIFPTGFSKYATALIKLMDLSNDKEIPL